MLRARPRVAVAGPLRSPCGHATTLGVYRTGRFDPTTRLLGDDRAGELWRATLTPDGPGHAATCAGAASGSTRQAWGAGGDWLLDRVPALAGQLDQPAADRRGAPGRAATPCTAIPACASGPAARCTTSCSR